MKTQNNVETVTARDGTVWKLEQTHRGHFAAQIVLCKESGTTAFMKSRHKFYELFRHKNLENIVKYNLLKARRQKKVLILVLGCWVHS